MPVAPPDDKSEPLRFSDLSNKDQDELQSLAYDSSPHVRASAFKSLAALPPKKMKPASRKSLRESIYDEDDRVIELGASLLGGIRDRQSVLPLVNLVDIGKPPVEQAAVKALGDIGDTRALPTLRRVADLELKKLSPLARQAIAKIRARIAVDGKLNVPKDLSAPVPSSSGPSHN